jgi:hypothetical protein
LAYEEDGNSGKENGPRDVPTHPEEEEQPRAVEPLQVSRADERREDKGGKKPEHSRREKMPQGSLTSESHDERSKGDMIEAECGVAPGPQCADVFQRELKGGALAPRFFADKSEQTAIVSQVDQPRPGQAHRLVSGPLDAESQVPVLARSEALVEAAELLEEVAIYEHVCATDVDRLDGLAVLVVIAALPDTPNPVGVARGLLGE